MFYWHNMGRHRPAGFFHLIPGDYRPAQRDLIGKAVVQQKSDGDGGGVMQFPAEQMAPGDGDRPASRAGIPADEPAIVQNLRSADDELAV